MRFPAIALALASAASISLMAALPVPAAAQQAADYIVAVVNSEPITNGEVRARMARFAQELQQSGQPLPPREVFARQVLERLINERAQIQTARENGVKIEEVQVDQAELQIARNNKIEVPELRTRLNQQGISTRQFRDDLRDQLILQRLREREFESKGKVTEIEVDQFLAEQEAAARDPANVELNVAHLLVAVPETATPAEVTQLQAKAQRLLERARAGEDFAKLGQEFTDGRAIGGNGLPVGARALDRLPPLFAQAVQNVPQGGLSPLVRSAAGFHVIKVLERRQGGLGALVTQTHTRHILLRTNANMTEQQAVARLADFKRRVAAGQADFAQLARDFSQDASARNGGDLGWANAGSFVPEFEEAMTPLRPGEISDPVVSRYGVHLIQVLERRQAKPSPQELREFARNSLREKKIDEAYATWVEDVRGRAFVDYRDPPR
jgi:peptidyl-prolyl cis-trans isomerase SurA